MIPGKRRKRTASAVTECQLSEHHAAGASQRRVELRTEQPNDGPDAAIAIRDAIARFQACGLSIRKPSEYDGRDSD
jgi:hypothetical protein